MWSQIDFFVRVDHVACRLSGEHLAFFDNIYRYSETLIDEVRHSNEGAMTALTQVLQASLTQSQASTSCISLAVARLRLCTLNTSESGAISIIDNFSRVHALSCVHILGPHQRTR